MVRGCGCRDGGRKRKKKKSFQKRAQSGVGRSLHVFHAAPEGKGGRRKRPQKKRNVGPAVLPFFSYPTAGGKEKRKNLKTLGGNWGKKGEGDQPFRSLQEHFVARRGKKGGEKKKKSRKKKKAFPHSRSRTRGRKKNCPKEESRDTRRSLFPSRPRRPIPVASPLPSRTRERTRGGERRRPSEHLNLSPFTLLVR